VRNLVSALKNLQFKSDLQNSDAFSFLQELHLPTPDYITLTHEDLAKVHDRDPDTIQKITHTYHMSWQNSPVTIMPQSETVRGDANIFDILDEQTNQKTVTIVHTPQPAFAGTITTFNPVTGKKSQHCISSTNGCFISGKEENTSHLLWDVRTNEVVSNFSPKTGTAGIRRTQGMDSAATHPDEQIPPKHVLQAIISAATQATRTSFQPLYLEWEYRNGELVFTSGRVVDLHESLLQISNFSADDQPVGGSSSANSQAKATLASGVTVCDGIVSGKPHQDILIISQLNARDLPKLKEISGIICYEPIRNETIVSYIKKHHIPCISQVKPVISRQALLSEITLNASLGKVLSDSENKQLVTQSWKNNDSAAYSKPKNEQGGSKLEPTMKVYEWQRNPFFKPPALNGTNSNSHNSAADGAVFNNDFLTLLQGTHPLHTIKKDPGRYTQTIVDALLQTHKKQTLTGYFTNDLHEQQLNNLTYGNTFQSMYSESEKNPYYGSRGGLHILHNPVLFRAEVTALAIASKKIKKDIPCIVPFLRTVPELVWVNRILYEVNEAHLTNIPLYFSIDLPSQIHQLQHFLRPSVKGVVVNLPRLHAISYGLDPENHVLLDHYQLDKSLLTQYLAQVTAHISSNIAVWIILESTTNAVLSEAYKWGVQAIITKPKHSKMYKKTILEQQESLLSSKIR
jgi:hypothetical protein